MGNIGIWQLLIVLLIVVFLFGTKRIRGLGADLGSAIKSFRGAMREEQSEKKDDEDAAASGRVIEANSNSESAKHSEKAKEHS